MKFFVSYSRSVQDSIREIIESLRQDGDDVWWDQDLQPGQDWWATILNNIESCQVCLFMISEKAVQSPYCMVELRYAMARNRLIMPFVMDGVSYMIPPEIMKSRIQFEPYQGGPAYLKERIRTTCQSVDWAQYKDRFAVRPSEPNTGAGDLVSQLTKAVALAHEGIFDEATRGFNDVLRIDFSSYGSFCNAWLEKINRYRDVANHANTPLLKSLAKQKWDSFLQQYRDEELFDPLGVQEKIAQQSPQRTTQHAPVAPRSSEEQHFHNLLEQMKTAKDRKPLTQEIIKMGPSVVPLVIAVLHEHDEDVKYALISALGSLGNMRAVDPLIAMLQDSSDKVRWRATSALGSLKDTRAVEPLIAALGDKNEYVRRSAADALARLGDTRAVEPLITAMRDSVLEVRHRAAVALGELGDKRAVAALTHAFKYEYNDVGTAAAFALEKIRNK